MCRISDSRTLPDAITLERRAGDNPALVLAQGENTARTQLTHTRQVIPALTDNAAELWKVRSLPESTDI